MGRGRVNEKRGKNLFKGTKEESIGFGTHRSCWEKEDLPDPEREPPQPDPSLQYKALIDEIKHANLYSLNWKG